MPFFGCCENKEKNIGLTHFAISLGSKEEVDRMTEWHRREGLIIYSEPRFTGEGFYESAIKDPDGNIVEITCNKRNINQRPVKIPPKRIIRS